jgi:hypothetical protein
MPGSLRQRGPGSWQLRAYLGLDADTGKERWATKTVHGSRRHATAQLREFVEEAGYARLRTGTVADLLDRWLAHASAGWSTSTLRQNRSIIECHLKPLLGHFTVNKLTTVDIDDVYRHLLRSGGAEGRPLAAGTVHRVHVVLHRALTQAVRWEWVWLNPASAASPPRVPPAELRPPSPDQVQRLLGHVEERDPDFATYLWLAASHRSGSPHVSGEECVLEQRGDVVAVLRSRPALIHDEVIPDALGRHCPEAAGGGRDVPARRQLAVVVKALHDLLASL